MMIGTTPGSPFRTLRFFWHREPGAAAIERIAEADHRSSASRKGGCEDRGEGERARYGVRKRLSASERRERSSHILAR
jgi:hypothetical protein